MMVVVEKWDHRGGGVVMKPSDIVGNVGSDCNT